jgi:hypothetical protein
MELAWHFVGSRLRDGRRIPKDGEWLVHKGPIEICASGLHASTCLIDAVHYALGNVLCRVAVDGVAERESDKLVAERRVILWRLDSEEVLRAFARKAALSVVHLWDPPEIVVRYLKTGDESLRDAARDAAWAAAARAAAGAARAAAWAAVWAAARAAAGAAAGAAAWATRAARAAAGAAAWAAAGAAAGAATFVKFNAQLVRMVCQAAGNPNDEALLKAVVDG